MSTPLTFNREGRQAPAPGGRKHIFYVESNKENAEMMRWVLTLAGYEVSISSSPDEALTKARSGGFDLILLEVRLLGRSGVALCKEIRAFNPEIPIVFFSTAAYAADIHEGLDAGANAYLIKPDDLDEIEATISKLISGKTISA